MCLFLGVLVLFLFVVYVSSYIFSISVILSMDISLFLSIFSIFLLVFVWFWLFRLLVCSMGGFFIHWLSGWVGWLIKGCCVAPAVFGRGRLS